MCMGAFVNVRYVCALHAGLVPEVRKGIRSTGPGVRDDCGLPCGCWVSNLVLCKSNTYFSRLSVCPAHWEANLNSFSHFFALLAQQLILVRKVFKVFSLSKAPFFFLLNSRVNTYAWKARGCNLWAVCQFQRNNDYDKAYSVASALRSNLVCQS